ncbi:MAG: hypothetical protein JWP81_1932 [Ferruginibacter sp.]|nr:hypothetical protein [Ferruginibacter sp.]
MKTDLKKAFEHAAEQHYWSGSESVSGPGSNLQQTEIIRREIPELLTKYKISTMLDAPCGDLFWMKQILGELKRRGIQYQGADIVSSLIEQHRRQYKAQQLEFNTINLIKSPIPRVDLVFTRDCFIHLSYFNIYLILKNYKNSGSIYLLTNTYSRASRVNTNVEGFFLWGRMLNMEKFPFYFGPPLEIIVEGCTEKDCIDDDKSLGLWELEQLNLNRLMLCLALLFLPERCTRIYKSSIHFLKRCMGFIQRRISA